MKRFKGNKPLRYILGAFLLLLLCYNLPNMAFLTLCLKEDIFRPPDTEVLVSACKSPGARGIPGGEAVFIYEGRTDDAYLLDLRTGEKRKVPVDPHLLIDGVFLSPQWVWLEGSRTKPESPNYRPDYIVDLKDGKRYEVIDLTWYPRSEGEFDPKYYEYFQSADEVFIHHGKNILIALSSDLNENKNFILSQSILIVHNEDYKMGELLERLLKDLSVNYEIVDFSLFDTDVPSPKNKYIARLDGIYLVETNQEVADGMINYFKGWYYDESGVIVEGYGYYLFTLPGTTSVFHISSPVLKLNLSPETPTGTPAP